ncbi:MAG: SMC family ATPase [Clostridia bacterium]|nr:SMC family ATPase [Clostridia bacterium]
MKPVYLEFCGVNSFSEKAVVDFRKLFSSGVFGIFGDTGSGKSTILDCIQLALYGTIDRSGETECINRKSDGFYILYDFELEVNGVRRTYRVRRERTRKASNNSKAYLYEQTENEKFLALAEGTRDVNQKLSEIIGLSLADFKMCIALPQGEFAGLVKAKPAERLALVARLFDLTKYGDKLKFYLKEKFNAAELALTVAETKLNALEDCSDERQAQAKTLVEDFHGQLITLEEKIEGHEKTLADMQKRLAEKYEYERAVAELKKAENELPMYENKRSILQRYALLKGLFDKWTEKQKKQLELAREQKNSDVAKLQLQSAELALEKGKNALSDGKFDERITEVNRILGRFENAKDEIEKCEECKRALETAREEYLSLKNAVQNEPFDEKIEKLNVCLEKLGGEESVADYVKNHLKDEILAQGYGQVCDDLRFLAEKYPQTQEDVAALIKKYTKAQGESTSFDLSKAQAEFKALEAEKKRLKAELDGLEKRKKLYEENESKKRVVEERGKSLRATYDILKGKTSALEQYGSLQEVTARFELLNRQKANAEQALNKAQEQLSSAKSDVEKYGAIERKCEEELSSLQSELETGLSQNSFKDISEVESLLKEVGDERLARERCDTFFARYGSWKTQLERVDKNSFEGVSDEGMYALKEQKRSLDESRKALTIEIGKAEQELKKLLETRKKHEEYKKEYNEKKRAFELWDKLRNCVMPRRSEKTLMDFVATEYLQDVCAAAGKTLLQLTNNRYFLRYQNGEFFVGDNLDSGQLRAVKTLSGGETFLVSLSLALSLSAAICQKSLRPIEFFFLDEGFGTLDGKLVETVMDVLGKLSKSFTIGLISHVEELKHRIGNKILVEGASDLHGSQIRLECF